MNILLIRLRLIGDVVFTTPAIRAIRRHLPAARLSYLVEAEAAPVVLENPHLDHVIVAPRPSGAGRLGGDLRLAARLHAAQYDMVVDFHGGPRSSWLAWASRAPRRIGYVVKARSWMYTDRVARPRALRARHSVENQFDLLVPLGIGPPDRDRDPTEMIVSPVADAAVARRLAQAGVVPGHRLVVIHVSAGNPFRRWPAASFVELVTALAGNPARRLVVTSGPSESDLAARIRAAARARLDGAPGAIVECGDFDLPELHALLGRAALFIGGDSGPLHLASTTGVPIVALYGPTQSARSAPWRPSKWYSEAVELDGLACRPCDQRRCEPGDYRCLVGIGPDAVFQAASRALEHDGRTACRA